jgi:hypothetical protein
MPPVYDWGKRKYDDRTIKLLYGLSGNRCAHPDCLNKVIADPTDFDDAENVSNIAHIYSATNRGPRPFTASMPSERFINGYDNLIVLCGYHHDLVGCARKYLCHR